MPEGQHNVWFNVQFNRVGKPAEREQYVHLTFRQRLGGRVPRQLEHLHVSPCVLQPLLCLVLWSTLRGPMLAASGNTPAELQSTWWLRQGVGRWYTWKIHLTGKQDTGSILTTIPRWGNIRDLFFITIHTWLPGRAYLFLFCPRMALLILSRGGGVCGINKRAGTSK